MSPKIRFNPIPATEAGDELEAAMRKVRIHLLSLKSHEADRAIVKLEGAVFAVQELILKGPQRRATHRDPAHKERRHGATSGDWMPEGGP